MPKFKDKISLIFMATSYRYGPSFGPYLARTHKYSLIAQMVQEFLC